MTSTLPQTAIPIENLLKPEFWQVLAPALHIAGASAHVAPTPFIPEEQANYLRQLVHDEGYLHGNFGAWHTPLSPIIEVIQHLKSVGLLPVFAFVYDEIWQLADQLSSTISCLLGEDYWLLPDFWAWHIDPMHAEAGWSAHRDKGYRALLSDGHPSSLTAWIPLTPATPLNGCMYILPADRDPVYGTTNDKNWQIHYPDIRALPADPGEFIIWNQAVLHWGSHSSPRATGQPRISCAFEFQRADIPAWNQPLLAPNTALDFKQRIRLIGKQIQQYQHMYPLPAYLSQYAENMIKLR